VTKETQVDKAAAVEEQPECEVIQLPGTERDYDEENLSTEYVLECLAAAEHVAERDNFDQCIVVLRNSGDPASEDLQVITSGTFHAESLSMLEIARIMVTARYNAGLTFDRNELPDNAG